MALTTLAHAVSHGITGIGAALRAVSLNAARIRAERPFDVPAREAVLDAAFGAAERRRKTCERLREDRAPADGLSFVAVADGRVVGTIRFWDVEAGRVPALMLGPVAVAESHRGAGLGAALIRHGLAEARKRGNQAVLLVGDAPYYARFGFTAGPVAALTLPGPVDRARFLGLELAPGGFTGAAGRVVASGALVEARVSDDTRLAA